MARRSLCAVFGLIVVAATASAAGPATQRLDDVLRTAVAQKRVPAVVAMVTTAEGVAYEGAYGVPKDAIFAIASMTKPVTSVAVMQLVESGKVKLDEPAATYLPELRTVQVLEGGSLRPAKRPMTVRMLLSHTAGFGYEFLNKELFDYVAQGKLPSIATGGDGFTKAPLVFDPGARWEYGINTDWLGKLVETVSGQTLEAYFRERIFAPLGMHDTFFEVPADKRARLVPNSQRQPDGTLAAQPVPPAQPVTFYSGGGGLHSTGEDYLKFIRALMAHGQLGSARILSRESVDAMGRNQIGDLELQLLPSQMPWLVKPGGVMPGSPDKFGLGFAMNSRALDEGRGAGTLSWAGIFNTYFWIDREKGIGALLLTQVLPCFDDGPRDLLDEFEQAVYAGQD